MDSNNSNNLPNENETIIDEIIESLDIDCNNEKQVKSKKTKINKVSKNKESSYSSINSRIKEEYEIIMDCNKDSDYFIYYKKQ